VPEPIYNQDMALPRAVLAFALLGGLCGCGEAPTPPTEVSRSPQMAVLRPVCTPVRNEIHCTETVSERDRGTVDVTTSATWSVADSNLSDGLAASSSARVASPGVIIPLRQGNIAIHVRYLGERSVATHTYAVDPAAPAVPLAPYLTGFVSEVDGMSAIAGVRVEIVDGDYDSGKSATTLINGYYFIEHLRMARSFTVRASKSGYLTSEATHPGFADGGSGDPEPSSLHFRLTRASAN